MTASQIGYRQAVTMNLDIWVPACGGTEEISLVRNKRILYCYNPKTKKHAWLDVDSDMIMTNEEYFALLGN
jgi:hypothetical protein